MLLSFFAVPARFWTWTQQNHPTLQRLHSPSRVRRRH
jgi:hypothetical protein